MSRAIIAACLVLAAACGDNPVAPLTGLDPIPVTVQHRTADSGEKIPSFRMSSSGGTWKLHVTTHAACATIVVAAIKRTLTRFDVVSRVTSNPGALCAPIPSNAVIDYSVTISPIASGPVRVNVFESRGTEPPEFLGTATTF